MRERLKRELEATWSAAYDLMRRADSLEALIKVFEDFPEAGAALEASESLLYHNKEEESNVPRS